MKGRWNREPKKPQPLSEVLAEEIGQASHSQVGFSLKSDGTTKDSKPRKLMINSSVKLGSVGQVPNYNIGKGKGNDKEEHNCWAYSWNFPRTLTSASLLDRKEGA